MFTKFKITICEDSPRLGRIKTFNILCKCTNIVCKVLETQTLKKGVHLLPGHKERINISTSDFSKQERVPSLVLEVASSRYAYIEILNKISAYFTNRKDSRQKLRGRISDGQELPTR